MRAKPANRTNAMPSAVDAGVKRIAVAFGAVYLAGAIALVAAPGGMGGEAVADTGSSGSSAAASAGSSGAAPSSAAASKPEDKATSSSQASSSRSSSATPSMPSTSSASSSKSSAASATSAVAGRSVGVPRILRVLPLPDTFLSSITPFAQGKETAESTPKTARVRAGELLTEFANERIDAAQGEADQARELAGSAKMRAYNLVKEARAAEAEAQRARDLADQALEEAKRLRSKSVVAQKRADQAKRNPLRAADAPEEDLSGKMTGEALKAVPTDKGVTTFAVDDAWGTPALAREQTQAIERAVREIEDAGYKAGFVFVDLASGAGIAGNADEQIYTASAFKAALSLYVLQEDEDRVLSRYDQANMESAIMYSSNYAYELVAATAMGQDYNDWLTSYDIAYRSSLAYYATTSAKSMARIWADIYQFLRMGDEGGAAKSASSDKASTDADAAKSASSDKDAPGIQGAESSNDKTDVELAQWFGDLLSRTNRSFIRDGLGDENVTVRNKAGWISDYEFCALNDCAYIDEEGRPYLMVIMTTQPDSDASSRRGTQLAQALFDARDSLRPLTY